MNDNLTPMMRQYHEIKRKLPGKLILFRLGDFYEMFFDDAVVASRELEITLTSRNRDKQGMPIPMCGVPHHAVEGYIARLVKKGYKLAICEQLEEPVPGKLVKREVVRVITPGTLTEDALLDPKDNNFLACLFWRGDACGLAFLDVSTGEFYTTELTGDGLPAKVIDELDRFHPSELSFPACNRKLLEEKSFHLATGYATPSELDDWWFHEDFARRILLERFQTSTLEGFGIQEHPLAIGAAGALLQYVLETSRLSTENIAGLSFYSAGDYLKLDGNSINNLELVKSVSGQRKHTLLDVLDFTQTNMGSRLLRNWILRPLRETGEIARRQDCVGEIASRYPLRDNLQKTLAPVQDVERLLVKITTGTAKPRDLLALRSSLLQFPRLAELLGELQSEPGREMASRFDTLDVLSGLLQRAIHDSPPPGFNEAGYIRDGYSPELDELRSIAHGGRNFIAGLEAKEKNRTGIPSLKVGYNRVFGYYIEVTKANLHLIPEDFQRRQTLANGERFITPELKEYEEKVLTAEDRMLKLEKELYAEIRQRITGDSRRLTESGRIIARADVFCSLAEAAVRYRYQRPEVVSVPGIEIRNGRHPILERIENSFVPNDCRLDPENQRIIILTGPNMGGKSTYLRQNALLVIMAQAGSFVPAEAARIGLIDQIFTRVGASDNLARGQSTFMVEMVETAAILNTCTPRSLILLDEVGRGTATFDGLSLAWSLSEYLHNHPERAAMTLFATHYHELTKLEDLYPGICNYCVTVQERSGEIVFLRKVVPGTASRSYGIEVARLAGMPKAVTQRAAEILKKLERKEIDLSGSKKSKEEAKLLAELQKRLF